MGASLSVNLTQLGVNEASRTAQVNVEVIVTSSAGTHNHYTDELKGATFYLTVDGNTQSHIATFGSAETGTFKTTLYFGAVTVSYGSSGTKTVTASAVLATGTSAGTISGSDSLTLTPISSSGSSGGDDSGDSGGSSGSGSTGSGSGSVEKPDDAIPGNCDVIGQAMLTGPGGVLTYYPMAQGYSIRNHDIATWEEIVIVKFITPAFWGVPYSLDINLYKIHSANSRFTATMCCALCTSDENYEMYFNAASVVNDPSQIASALLLDNDSLKSFSIRTDQLESQKEYYLILWQPTDYLAEMYIEIGPAAGHGITVDYYTQDGVFPIEKGMIFIDNGTELTGYQCYIDNGAGWDMVGGARRATGIITDACTDVTVECGFKPDIVVLTGLSYTDSTSAKTWELQLTAVFQEQTTASPIMATAYSDDTDWMEVEIARTDTGFSLANFTGYDENNNAIESMQFNYVAIKYT